MTVMNYVESFPVRICPTDGIFLALMLRVFDNQYPHVPGSASPLSDTSVCFSQPRPHEASGMIYLEQCEKRLLKIWDYHVASAPPRAAVNRLESKNEKLILVGNIGKQHVLVKRRVQTFATHKTLPGPAQLET